MRQGGKKGKDEGGDGRGRKKEKGTDGTYSVNPLQKGVSVVPKKKMVREDEEKEMQPLVRMGGVLSREEEKKKHPWVLLEKRGMAEGERLTALWREETSPSS